jgi:ketosteroid isomerase-like protein
MPTIMGRTLLILLALLPFAGCYHSPDCTLRADPKHAANERLDTFHAAAAVADFNAYFNCFTDDAIFLGTDATERWTVDQFKAYCKPYFDQGKGWVYTPRDRHLMFVPGYDHAFIYFDELLDNAKYGTCRGTGVMVLAGSPPAWRIAHYSLSFMIPNDKAAEVTTITKSASTSTSK